MLNTQQKEAVEHFHGPCFVSACPGSGKTRIIVERTLRLVERGIPARSILCITFTNKAASEMRERLAKKLGEKANEIYISTFHALCATVLRKYGSYLGYGLNTTILDDDEQNGLLIQCSRQLGFDIKKPDLKALLNEINNLRESLISDDEICDSIIDKNKSKIAREYIDRMRKNNQLDFSGILSETYRLLKADSSVLSMLQQRFDFIQVDETQDTNYAQFTIVNMLGAHGNILIVGDSDQGIYSWRGARYENISDFVRDRHAKVIELYENYRSTPEIVKTAATLVEKNTNRAQKIPFKTSNANGSPVQVYSLPSVNIEGKYIATIIKDLIEKQNYKPSDIAILYRINSMSRAIEQGLVECNIPYEVFGGLSFYDRIEVKDSIAILRFLINPNDGIALGRFINKPSCKIGDATIGLIENYAKEQNIDLLDAMRNIDNIDVGSTNKLQIQQRCKKIVDAFDFDLNSCKLNIGEIIAQILDKIDYNSYLTATYDDKEVTNRKENLKELLDSCAVFSESHNRDIGAYLTSIALQTSTDKKAEEDCVSLMSIHASKGLEFPVVFMPCLQEDSLPHKRALEEGGLEEERRLCYVGMTRAEKLLVLSYATKRAERYYGNVGFKPARPSRFLYESGAIANVKHVK